MISTQYINLNMVPFGVMPVLHCSQYDVGRPLGVVIYNGSESVDLSGYTVTIEGTRTDRTPVTAGVTTDGNIGVFTTTPTMTNENDTYRAKVVLTDNAGRVSSLAFVMCVDEKTMDENAEEIEEDASLYQQYTGTVQTIIAQIRGDLAAEITARQNAVSAEATARQNAISAEASARQAADNTLQSNINAEASARATEDASLQSQINQLIAPSGSAPSAAEVENARIGADGVTYPTLGDAIRTNDSLLKSHLDEYSNIISTSLMGVDVQENLYPGAADWGGTWINSDPPTTGVSNESFDGYPAVYASASYRRFYKEIPVVAGKTYTFEGWIKHSTAGTVQSTVVGTYTTNPATVSENYITVSDVPANTWTKVKFTFTCSASGNVSPLLYSRAGAFYVAKYVLVEGTEVFSLKKIVEKVERSQEHPVRYNDIINDDINLADGTYTANGSATVSGDTATVTASYDGIISNEFTLVNNNFRVNVTSTFNVPRLVFKLQYYTDSWKTTLALFDLTSGTESEEIINVSSYGASKFRVLLQNFGLTEDITNTIRVDALSIVDLNEIETSPYYDSDFEVMLTKIFDGIGSNSKIYTCLKNNDPNAPGDFDNFVTAVQTLTQIKDARLFVGAGEWDVISEFGSDYMSAVSSSPSTWGLVLKNRIHIVGSARTVIKAINADGSTNHDNIKQYFSVFNAGEHGFTIENLTIVDDSIRYSVHDDLGGAGPKPYHNRYINCSMKHTNGMYPDCIGAGIGEDGYIEIRGCYFDGDIIRNGNPVTRYVYWHGNNNANVTNAKGRIYVTDNYFCNTGTFKLTRYGNSTTKTIAYVSNNSFGSQPEITNGSSPSPIIDNMEMVQWNNEIRT